MAFYIGLFFKNDNIKESIFKMNIEHTGREQLLKTLQESRSFKRNPVPWAMFYVSASATTIMFIILICYLCGRCTLVRKLRTLFLRRQVY